MYPELTLPNLLSCLPITSQEQTWKNSYECPLQGDYFKGKGWSSNHHFWGAKCFQESFHCSSGSLQTLLVMFHLFCGKKEMDLFAPFLVAKMIAPLQNVATFAVRTKKWWWSGKSLGLANLTSPRGNRKANHPLLHPRFKNHPGIPWTDRLETFDMCNGDLFSKRLKNSNK